MFYSQPPALHASGINRIPQTAPAFILYYSTNGPTACLKLLKVNLAVYAHRGIRKDDNPCLRYTIALYTKCAVLWILIHCIIWPWHLCMAMPLNIA